MKLLRVWLPLAAFGGLRLLQAQTSIDLRTQTKSVDFSSAAFTKPSKVGTSLPATCTLGETFFNSAAAAGHNWYGCTAANVWTLLGANVWFGGGSVNTGDCAQFNSSGNIVSAGGSCGAPTAVTLANPFAVTGSLLVSGGAGRQGVASLCTDSGGTLFCPGGFSGQVSWAGGNGTNSRKLLAPAGAFTSNFNYVWADAVPTAATLMKIGAPSSGASSLGPAIPDTDYVSPSGSGTLQNKTLDSSNLFGSYIPWTQIATPSAPASGGLRVYAKSGTGLCWMNSSGTETCPGNGGTSSVFGRTGAVTAQTGDYSYAQISNTPGSLPPNGTASGDLSGSYPSPTVSQVNGAAVPASGVLKANGSHQITQATAGTDYAPPPSGTSILKGSGAGGFTAAAAGMDYAPATAGSSVLKGNGAGGFANAAAGTDYAPATAGGSVLKGNGAGGFTNAAAGTDYAPATAGGSVLKGNGAGGFANAAAGADYAPATAGSSVLKGNGIGGFASATAGSDYMGVTTPVAAAQMPALTGDCTSVAGSVAMSCGKANGVAFAASATTDTTSANNISGGTLNAARLPATAMQTNQSNIVNGGTQDFHGAAHTLPEVSGPNANKPSTCTVGEVYFATDATAGQNQYYCTATNTWTQQAGGSTMSSVFGRTGVVTAQAGDYAYAQISNTPAALPPNGTAAGDLSGAYPNPTVAQVNGAAIPTAGVLKSNGSRQIVAAVSGTDYAPATSGTAMLKANGSGGFGSAIGGTDYELPLTFASPLSQAGVTVSCATATSANSGCLASGDWTTFNNKQNALTNPITGTGQAESLAKFTAGGTIANATAGSDYAPATAGTSLLKGNGGGGFAAAAAGTDYAPATGTTAVLKGSGSGGFSSALAGDVVNLFSGCSGTQYLGADGSCHTASGGSGGGSGSVVLSTGAGTPSANCAAPSSTNLAVYLDTTNGNQWWCSAGNTWQKVLSVTGSGPYQVTGATGGAAGTPAGGTVTCYFATSGSAQVCLDASGIAWTMLPPSGTAIANATTGNAATATAFAATPTQCGGSQFATGVSAAGNANCATPGSGGSAFQGATATATSGIGGTASAPTFSLADESAKSPVRFEFTLSANATVASVSNLSAGAKFSVVWTQPSSGSAFTLSWGSLLANAPCTITPTISSPAAFTEQFFEVASNGASIWNTGCESSDGFFSAPEISAPATAPASSASLWPDSLRHTMTSTSNSSPNVHIMPRTAGGTDQLACDDLSNAASSCSTDTTNAGNIGSGTLPNGRLSAVPLTALAPQAQDTVVMNTLGSAAPGAVAMPVCTTGADLYNTTTHSWSCVSVGSSPTDLGGITYNAGGTTTFAAASAVVAGGAVTTTHSTSTTFTPTGLVKWGSYTAEIVQDTTGGGVTFTLGTGGACSAWKVVGGGSGAITLSTAANARDVLAFTYDGTNCIASFGANAN